MPSQDSCVTIAPYFDVPPDKLAEVKATMPKFIDKTRSEKGCVNYAFSISGNIAHCPRELR